jgi:hypothetical protein
MKRSTPMRRVALKAKARDFATRGERRPVILRPIRVPEPTETVFVQTPKHEYVRSDALRIAYRALPCQHCGDDGPDAGVVCAHANWAVFGKGMGVKASHDRAASLCFVCHRELDQGSRWSGADKRRIWAAAHVKTVGLLCAKGLWPKDVPTPDMSVIAEWLA